jgi:hypothetical protein
MCYRTMFMRWENATHMEIKIKRKKSENWCWSPVTFTCIFCCCSVGRWDFRECLNWFQFFVLFSCLRKKDFYTWVGFADLPTTINSLWRNRVMLTENISKGEKKMRMIKIYFSVYVLNIIKYLLQSFINQSVFIF